MKKITIIHFQPLEYYPPIQNLLRVLFDSSSDFRVQVLTTGAKDAVVKTFELPSGRIAIHRLGSHSASESSLKRYFNYARFYGGCLLQLIVNRPATVLYFETLSAFPAYVYKKFFKRSAALMVHYHEYTSPQEYARGPMLNRYFHKLEKKLYSSVSWISHTNADRLGKFKTDILPVSNNQTHVIPNFPPRSWRSPAKLNVETPVKIVYAGAISMDTMFTREFAEWVTRQDGKVIWDIYSLNVTTSVREFFDSMKSAFITLKGPVSYDELPAMLRQYDIGVILYNGHIPNYVYNAPNKLFEYAACGLSVLFPDVMIGSLPYITGDEYPFVKAIDFRSLDSELKTDKWIGKHSLSGSHEWFCENALTPLVEKLIK